MLRESSPSGAVHADFVCASPQLLLSTQAFASTAYSFAASSPVRLQIRGLDSSLISQLFQSLETWYNCTRLPSVFGVIVTESADAERVAIERLSGAEIGGGVKRNLGWPQRWTYYTRT